MSLTEYDTTSGSPIAEPLEATATVMATFDLLAVSSIAPSLTADRRRRMLGPVRHQGARNSDRRLERTGDHDQRGRGAGRHCRGAAAAAGGSGQAGACGQEDEGGEVVKDKPFEVWAERTWMRNNIELLIRQELGNGKMAVGRPIIMETVENEGQIIEPTLRLSFDQAQYLIDQLWRCGMRPTEGAGSAGSLAATEKHLKDMQTIAMGLLRKDGMQ